MELRWANKEKVKGTENPNRTTKRKTSKERNMQDNIILIVSLALNIYFLMNELKRLAWRMKERSKKNNRFQE
jgi:hypothetical protein